MTRCRYRLWIGALRFALSGIVAVSAEGCHGLLSGGASGLTEPSAFENPQGAVQYRNQAVASFVTANGNQVVWSGLVADELSAYGQTDAKIDALNITLDNLEVATVPLFGNLTTARLNILTAIQLLETYAPQPADRVGQLFAFLGFVELYFAEDYCSGVPVASVVKGVPSTVTVLSRDSLIARAEAHFDSAAAYANQSGGQDAQLLQLAQVGMARALLAGNAPTAAAQALQSVGPGFSYPVVFDGAVQFNPIYSYLAQNRVMSVADRQGGDGIDFVSGADPRLVLTTFNAGSGPGYIPTPDTSAAAFIVLASSEEASLVRAEAALRSGQVGAWADTLNALRTAYADTALSNHPLPADSTTGASPALQLAVMFRERAFWLFLSGHWQGDMRRLVRQYGLPVTAVFPTGPYPGAGATSFGTSVVFQPTGESNDAAYHGCLDTSP